MKKIIFILAAAAALMLTGCEKAFNEYLSVTLHDQATLEEIFSQELGGLGIADWTTPKGGYFISYNTMEGCAKEVVSKCAKAGVILTNAGATWPGGNDPHDSNIRVAPSFPPLEDLKTAARVLALCTKLVSVQKLLEEAE